jgi:hypothetical protein
MLLPPYVEMIHGTAFPANPVERQLFYRDDLHAWFQWNGAGWVNLHNPAIIIHDIAGPWHTSGATPGQILQADINGLPIDATNTDAQLALAVLLAHARQHLITDPLDHTSGATPGRILQADPNGLPIDATNTDAQVAGAVIHVGIQAVGVHGSTVLATPNRLVHRDAAGRSQIANPAANPDIDNMGSRNVAIAAEAAARAAADAAEAAARFAGDAAEAAARAAADAAHALLATGTHGVGFNYIPQAPAANHVLRTFTKGWATKTALRGNGVNTDPTEIYVPQFDSIYFHCDMQTVDQWTFAYGGSGSSPAKSILWSHLSTGATANSYARQYTTTQFPNSGIASEPFWFFKAQNYSATLTPPSTHEIRIYMLDFLAAIPPSAISDHYGFRITNGRVYATNADGLTETSTDTGWDIPSNWAHIKLFVLTDATHIYYYLNDTLVATHTSNLPASNNFRFYVDVTNPASAADRALLFITMNFGYLGGL